MPKGRLEYLRRLLPYLQNQSEDCLYLNIYVPIQGKFTFTICSSFCFDGFFRCFSVRQQYQFRQIKLMLEQHLRTHDPHYTDFRDVAINVDNQNSHNHNNNRNSWNGLRGKREREKRKKCTRRFYSFLISFRSVIVRYLRLESLCWSPEMKSFADCT